MLARVVWWVGDVGAWWEVRDEGVGSDMDTELALGRGGNA